MEMQKSLEFREDTSDLLKNYAFKIQYKIKIFCPNCFVFYDERKLSKHFGKCAFKLEGRKFFENEKIIISKIYNDQIFKTFLKKFNKFVELETREIKSFPYNEKYDYWILQYFNPNFNILLIGIAFVRIHSKFNRFVLPAILIFPKNNRNKGYAKLFIKEINKYYKRWGGLIIESPNEIIKKVANELKIEYYYHY